MKTVVVIGGGPAGAFAAERLAGAGLRTVLLDEKLAWEKPCGGGLTYKAYHRYPLLIDNHVPKKLIFETRLSAKGAGSARLRLRHPLLVYSRLDLNQHLLDRAETAGVQIEKERVLEVERTGRGWKLRTRAGALEASFCIVATGARNSLRNVGTEWTRDDTMCAIGYYVPARQEHVEIQFLPRFEGYIWVFPRCGHLSVGICGKSVTAQWLRTRLEQYLAERSISLNGAHFYGHLIPSLGSQAWRRNRVSGDRWLAVGDAAGLVDPVTGEGLYYAMRSADLAAGVLIEDAVSPACNWQRYRAVLSQDFTADLEYGAHLARRLFTENLLCAAMTARMIQFMRRSQSFTDVMQDLFAGTQPYTGLKRRLLENLNGTFTELAMSVLLRRFVPNQSTT